MVDEVMEEEIFNLLTPNGSPAIVMPFGGTFEYMVYDNPKLDSFEFLTEMGYADQSHLIKDFVEFTGKPPLKFFKNPNDYDVDFKENNPNW